MSVLGVTMAIAGAIVAVGYGMMTNTLLKPPACHICHGSRRVCENHRDKSWPDECDCGAGMNCPLCANEERK